MSNETPSDKKQPMPPKERELTRVPVRHLYFMDNMDLQGASMVSNLKCYPDPPTQPNHHTASYVPAYQAFEIVWHRRGVDPDVRFMPAVHVKTWTPG